MLRTRNAIPCFALVMPLAAFIATPGLTQEPPARATVSLGQWHSRKLTRDEYKGMTQKSRTASFDVGAVPYSIMYTAAVDASQPDKAFPVEGYIGMPAPSSENWYHSGFLFIIINGQDIGRTPLSSMIAAESGDRAILDLVWRSAAASVRARFVGLPGDDALYVEVAVEPHEEITSVQVRTRCYPSFFTSWHKRVGARRIQTPSTLVEEGKPQQLPAADNWWAIYYDEVFDVARGEGVGPCAMMVLPEDAADIAFDPGGYAVNTRVAYPATARRLRLAFWDFKGRTNADVLAAMPDAFEETRKRLAELDFTPKPIREFDVAKAQEEVRRALESQAVRNALGAKLDNVREWLQQAAPAPVETRDAPRVDASEKMLEHVDEFNEFVWEVKLAKLLDF